MYRTKYYEINIVRQNITDTPRPDKICLEKIKLDECELGHLELI